MALQVSVVIPLYNARAFLKQAVASALAQPEVEEVVIVDDGSSDGSFSLAQELTLSETRIHLFQHNDHANQGAGASRNLGIRKCTMPYVAFLDADDYFLTSRFTGAGLLYDADPLLGGVYEAVGTLLNDEVTASRWRQHWPGGNITMMSPAIRPANLFEALVAGGQGHFHLDGLTVRRDVFKHAGLFSETLRLHQDTEFCIRLAACVNLQSGSQQPVAVRRFHPQSRILAAREQPDHQNIDSMYQQLMAWGEANLPLARRATLRRAAQIARLRSESAQLAWVGRMGYLLKALSRNPGLISQAAYWKLYLSPLIGLRDKHMRSNG